MKTLADHNELAAKAAAANRLCVVEVHKRYDPIYVDARDRIGSLGAFSYFTAHMSQVWVRVRVRVRDPRCSLLSCPHELSK